MTNRVLLKKLLFLRHVATLPIGTLARDSYQSQCDNDLPGLVKELESVLEDFGVSDITVFSKNQWAKFVKEKIHEKNKKEIIKMSERCRYKVKSEHLTNDSFRMKPYFEELSLHEARYKFRIISHSMPLAMKMRRKRRFSERGWILGEFKM